MIGGGTTNLFTFSQHPEWRTAATTTTTIGKYFFLYFPGVIAFSLSVWFDYNQKSFTFNKRNIFGVHKFKFSFGTNQEREIAPLNVSLYFCSPFSPLMRNHFFPLSISMPNIIRNQRYKYMCVRIYVERHKTDGVR